MCQLSNWLYISRRRSFRNKLLLRVKWKFLPSSLPLRVLLPPKARPSHPPGTMSDLWLRGLALQLGVLLTAKSSILQRYSKIPEEQKSFYCCVFFTEWDIFEGFVFNGLSSRGSFSRRFIKVSKSLKITTPWMSLTMPFQRWRARVLRRKDGD